METLKDLYDHIVSGGTFEEIDFNKYEEVNCPCECIDNKVYEDENLYEFMRELKTNNIKRTETQVFLSDEVTTVSVDYIDVPNRFNEDSPNETIFMFDTIKLVP